MLQYTAAWCESQRAHVITVSKRGKCVHVLTAMWEIQRRPLFRFMHLRLVFGSDVLVFFYEKIIDLFILLKY